MITKSETETTHFIGMSDNQVRDLGAFFDAFQARDLAGIMRRTIGDNPDKVEPINETLFSLKDAVAQCKLEK